MCLRTLLPLLWYQSYGNAAVDLRRFQLKKVLENSIQLASKSLNAGNELYLSGLKATCPESGGDDNLSPLDHVSPTLFDNSYYINLVNGEGLLPSDQEMYSNGLASITALIVKEYATDPLGFAKQFSDSMVKMGNIVNPVTLLTGEVRKNCRIINQ